VRKMTSLPASQFGLAGRGELREGGFADIAVIDPVKIRDVSTYSDPHRLAEGVTHVIVNGRSVLSLGKLTGVRPGVWL